LGCLLAYSPNAIRCGLGVGLSVAAAAVHPALLAFAPGAVLGLAARGRVRGGGIAVATVVVLLAGASSILLAGGSLPAPPLHPTLEPTRVHHAMELLAASPWVAQWDAPRDLLPTGHEALAGLWPVERGLAVWLLLLGLACLTTGIRGAAVAAVAAFLAGVGAPLVTPAWIPGERALALLPLIPLAALMANALATVRGRVPRDVAILLSVFLMGAAFWQTHRQEQEGVFAFRRVVMDLPYREGLGFLPVLEPDPARLVLYSHDLRELEAPDGLGNRTRVEAQRIPTAGYALGRLEKGGLAIDGAALRRLALALAEDPRAAPSSATPEQAELFERLTELEIRLAEISAEVDRGSNEAWYHSVQHQLQVFIPDAMEIAYAELDHPRAQRFLQALIRLVEHAATWASELGDLHYSVPLREIIVQFSEGQPARYGRARAILGLELFDMGRIEEAAAELEAAIPLLRKTDVLWVVAKAAHAGIAIKQGRSQDALQELNDAWSGLMARDSNTNLAQAVPTESLDYWLIADLLRARYELVKELDPSFQTQSRRDLEKALGPGLDRRPPLVPALAIAGRLALVDGRREDARRLLMTLREVETKTLVEKGGGLRGRMNTPRFRLLGLRSLVTLLDPAEDADVLAEVETEIRDLDRY
jgi:tetratricopeptide (TPR) repeat protein